MSAIRCKHDAFLASFLLSMDKRSNVGAENASACALALRDADHPGGRAELLPQRGCGPYGPEAGEPYAPARR